MADTFDDPDFGHLTWDLQLNCWLGGVALPPYFLLDMAVAGMDGDGFRGSPAARESWGWLRKHEPEARRQVAAEMVELYNDCWTDEDDPITTEEFARRIEL